MEKEQLGRILLQKVCKLFREEQPLNRTAGSNHDAVLPFDLAVSATRAISTTWAISAATVATEIKTAFGIFFRFHVAHFDPLGLFFCAILFYPVRYFGLLGVCLVSVTPKGN